MLDQPASAWVTPTNARGQMDGGLDLVIKQHLGAPIELAVQRSIREDFGGTLRVGQATCLPTGRPQPAFLISTPTMKQPSEDISDSLNVALACAVAAFPAVRIGAHAGYWTAVFPPAVLFGLGLAALAFPEVWAHRSVRTGTSAALTDDAVAGPPV